MIKPWSITTTLRNPERLRSFLKVAQQIEGNEWNLETQVKYQVLLIQNRLYGYGNAQFYSNLSEHQASLIGDITKEINYKQAEEIFITKNYEDPPMRGRQSLNPLTKLGFVSIVANTVRLSSLGKLFLKDDFDYGEVFLNCFLKWQIPNPLSREFKIEDGYNIKPFVGTIHLINSVNKKWVALNHKPKGISKHEFSLFVPTLVNFSNIENQAQKIIDLRLELLNKNRDEQKEVFESYEINYAKEFLSDNDLAIISKLLKNLKDYGDNAIRYFRLTRLFYIRGNGYYVDLEPRRSIEIENLLSFDNAQSLEFSSKEAYSDYLSDIKQPKLPWESKDKYIGIIDKLIEEIRIYANNLSVDLKEILDVGELSESELKQYIQELRDYRRSLQEKELHIESQNIANIEEYIQILENIYTYENKPLLLEKTCSLGLNALNDAIKIQPNYPVGDDNEPTFTAPANTPDIECYYEVFNSICEVTMLTSRDQWYNEGQPVMRHLRDFEIKHNDKVAFCIFIAPKLHRDTVNTFHTAVKYEYEGKQQKIIPLTINNFVELLKILTQLKKSGKFLSHIELENLYNEIIKEINHVKDSHEWINSIPNIIQQWKSKIVS
ncbi:MAG: AlwI family type II restriction endonuclease [Candidatus Cloacimonadales bacterium]